MENYTKNISKVWPKSLYITLLNKVFLIDKPYLIIIDTQTIKGNKEGIITFDEIISPRVIPSFEILGKHNINKLKIIMITPLNILVFLFIKLSPIIYMLFELL